MKEIYIVATEQESLPSFDELRVHFEAEQVAFTPEPSGAGFSISAGESRVEVRFDLRESGLGWTPDLVTGSESCHEVLRKAKRFYRIAFTPRASQPTAGVFEALWCARVVLEQTGGVLLDVTAFKLHDVSDVIEITELDFDIRDHLNLHAVEATSTETPLWVHSHGMEKFGVRDVEVFHLGEEDLVAAETFLQELCTDIAFGQGPELRQVLETSAGAGFMLVPSDEARRTLFGFDPEVFDGHEGHYWTVVSSDGRHSLAEILRPYRGRFESESPEESDALLSEVAELLPSFQARFQRKGLMDPLTFLVRVPFESHPKGETVTENLWVELVTWTEEGLVGKLVDGGQHTTEWRKGAMVEFDEGQINAIALGREGRTLENEEMKSILVAERPA